MRNYDCRRCGETIEHVCNSGRKPWYCQPCIHEKYVERIQARNIADRTKRRALRNPNCRDCDQPLTFNDSGSKMDMRIYCNPCLTKGKRSQDSRRIGAKPMADIMREAAERRTQPITQDLLKQLFLYDSNTGVFTRLSTGFPTGQKKRGYISVDVFGRPRPAHQLAWIYCYGEIPAGLEVDHIDRNPGRNVISNLRLATRSQNGMNTGGSHNALGVKCVFLWRNGYRTKIAINGKQMLIGDYPTPFDAWRCICQCSAQTLWSVCLFANRRRGAQVERCRDNQAREQEAIQTAQNSVIVVCWLHEVVP
jgi:hypothetical protein